MNAIEIRYSTAQQAQKAYDQAHLSPYIVNGCTHNTVAIGSKDTAATSLVAWAATNLPAAVSYKVL